MKLVRSLDINDKDWAADEVKVLQEDVEEQEHHARDANISMKYLIKNHDCNFLFLDCKLIKYKLAFVVCLWPWSVFTHYICNLYGSGPCSRSDEMTRCSCGQGLLLSAKDKI